MLRGLLFDLDGTLTDSDPVHFRAWRECLAEHGVEIDEEGYRQRVSGRLNPEIVADLLPDLDEAEARAFIERKEEAFRALASGLEPLTGLGELLDWAEGRGLRLALVTNAPRRNAEFMLRALDLLERFPTVVIADEGAAGKPDPAPYLRALELLGLKAGEALALEDSPSGVRSARAAGLTVIGVTTTQDPETLVALGAAVTVADFSHPKLWRLLGSAEGDIWSPT